jgi:hypothetical protein
MEWISAKDRLPQEFVNVLCFIPDQYIFMGSLRPHEDVGESKWEEQHYGYPSHALDAVTHWMPLPEPPQITSGQL